MISDRSVHTFRFQCRIFLFIIGFLYSFVAQSIDLPLDNRISFYEGIQPLSLNLEFRHTSQYPLCDSIKVDLWISRHDCLIGTQLNFYHFTRLSLFPVSFDSTYFPSRAPPFGV